MAPTRVARVAAHDRATRLPPLCDPVHPAGESVCRQLVVQGTKLAGLVMAARASTRPITQDYVNGAVKLSMTVSAHFGWRVEAHNSAGQMVGMVTAEKSRNNPDTHLWVNGLLVSHSYRRFGLARNMMKLLCHQADHNHKSLSLIASPGAETAGVERITTTHLERFYHSLGFESTDGSTHMHREPLMALCEHKHIPPGDAFNHRT